MTSYDDVAYPSLPLAQLQPDRWAAQSALLGVTPVAPSSARVLELGCSDAGNLAALAANNPKAEFLGVDLAPSAVQRAQAMVEGLPNIAVVHGDIRSLEAGLFDYVIAHGIYSWIPKPDDLLVCIARHLAPDGISYVSFNAMPGSHLRMMAGDVLRRVADGRADRLQAAREVFAFVRTADVDTRHARIMRQVMAEAEAKPDHVLLHDEMSSGHRAYYFDEFIGEARTVGLDYLAEAHLGDSPVGSTDVPVGDEIHRQQWLDYARNRSFRQTLLVHRGRAPTDYTVQASRLGGLWVAAPARRVARDSDLITYSMLSGVEASTTDPGLAADLDRIGRTWPACVRAADLACDPEALLRLYRARALEVRFSPVPAVMPGDLPTVREFVRRRALVDGLVTNLRHEVLSLDDELSRTAVSLMDGRHLRPTIAGQLSQLPDASVDVGRHLDRLLEDLGRSSLMLG